MIHIDPLLAAGRFDWIQVLVPFVVFIIYVINHIIGESKQAAKRAQRNASAAQAGAGQRPTERPRASTAPVAADEIEEFLRRAAQQRKEKDQSQRNPSPQPQRQATPPRRQPATRDNRTTTVRPSQQQRPKEPPARRLAEQAPSVDRGVADQARARESVAEHVAKHLSTEEFDVRAIRMRQDMAVADVQREEHLKKMFGHKIGSLSSDKPAPPEAKMTDTAAVVDGPATGGLGGLLHGDTLRYAVILNEILTRPEHRW